MLGVLQDAKSRDVRVRLITDLAMAREAYSKVTAVINNDIPVRRHPSYTMHHKMVIVDDTTAIVGSLNWSHRAVSTNRESMFVLSGPVVAQVARAFRTMWAAFVVGTTEALLRRPREA